MNDDDDLDYPGLYWDNPHFYLNGQIFIPKIYSLERGEVVPKNFNTVSIKVDGRVKSDLDWSHVLEKARKYAHQNYQLYFVLDLGLFQHLERSLINQTQLLSLILSIEHFQDSIWKELKNHIVGVCLYEGSADFSSEIHWDEHLNANYLEWGHHHYQSNFDPNDLFIKSLFCRNLAADYLIQLANRMPDGLETFIKLKLLPYFSITQELLLTHREKFDSIHLLIEGSKLKTSDQATIGICLPAAQKIQFSDYQNVERVIKFLQEEDLSFKIIPERYLISEWDELDYLIIDSDGIENQTFRKLQGFAAAGGTVVHLGPALNLSQEISEEQFLNQLPD